MHWHAIILQPCILRILWVQYTTCFAGEVHSRRASKGGFLDEWPSPGTAGHSCFRPAHQPPVTNQVNQVSFTFSSQSGKKSAKMPQKVFQSKSGWIFWLVPPRKFGTGRPNRKSDQVHWSHPRHKRWQSLFQHSRLSNFVKYPIYCRNTDTISRFPPFKYSPTHSNACPSLVFHLVSCSDNHGLLVVVEVVDHLHQTEWSGK